MMVPKYTLEKLHYELFHYFGLSQEKLYYPRGNNTIVLVRQIYCYLAYIYMHKSTTEIAEYIKKREQSVRYSIKQVKEYIEVEDVTRMHLHNFVAKHFKINKPKIIEALVDREFEEYEKYYKNANFKNLKVSLKKKFTDLFMEEYKLKK